MSPLTSAVLGGVVTVADTAQLHSYETALDALYHARAAFVAEAPYECLDPAFRHLALCVDSVAYKVPTRLAIMAVLDRDVNPNRCADDASAWTHFGASRSNFKKWKRDLKPLLASL